jgi:hypothetical protein
MGEDDFTCFDRTLSWMSNQSKSQLFWQENFKYMQISIVCIRMKMLIPGDTLSHIDDLGAETQ